MVTKRLRGTWIPGGGRPTSEDAPKTVVGQRTFGEPVGPTTGTGGESEAKPLLGKGVRATGSGSSRATLNSGFPTPAKHDRWLLLCDGGEHLQPPLERVDAPLELRDPAHGRVDASGELKTAFADADSCGELH
jgi:hypothetical protein